MQKLLQTPASRIVALSLATALVSGALFIRPVHAADTDVSMTDNAFSPQTITIQQGDMVTWTNDGNMEHNVTADDGTFQSGTLDSGETYSHTFDTPGTYRYYCSFHGGPGGQGMSGIVIVTSSSSSTSSNDNGSASATSSNATSTSSGDNSSSTSTAATSTDNGGTGTTTATSTNSGGTGTSTATSTPGYNRDQQIAQLRAIIAFLQARLQILIGGGNPGTGTSTPPMGGGIGGNMGDMMSTVGTAVFADDYSIPSGSSFSFHGQGFAPSEQVVVFANGSPIASGMSDSSGNISGSIPAVNSSEDTDYWFVGQSSDNKDSLTISVLDQNDENDSGE